MCHRKYLPTFADLIDRLSIVQLKIINIPEHKEEYEKEKELIMNDIEEILNYEKSVKITSKLLWAIQVVGLVNKAIWDNESRARAGGAEQDKLLKFTHSLNGIRNTAKNIISIELGERIDLRVDCLAAELCEEFGNWNIFENEK